MRFTTRRKDQRKAGSGGICRWPALAFSSRLCSRTTSFSRSCVRCQLTTLAESQTTGTTRTDPPVRVFCRCDIASTSGTVLRLEYLTAVSFALRRETFPAIFVGPSSVTRLRIWIVPDRTLLSRPAWAESSAPDDDDDDSPYLTPGSAVVMTRQGRGR